MIGDPIIDRLRTARMAQGLGQRDTERRAGVGVNTLSQWENGGGATLTKVRAVADVLGFDLVVTKRKLTAEHKAALWKGRDDAATARAARSKCGKGHDMTADDAIYFDDSGGVRCAQCRRERGQRFMRATRASKDRPFPLIPRNRVGSD